ncbi:i-AAA protease YME1 [Aspergillus saccharolyticus JOP 1030-1]|uniref:Intermembrane space AAA protease IAP-1 n=1 Tax=Aspergillus saccharolyticus JOP 1030-1 TaxID=1450539 RepID=A0A318ZI18_9EURO|nr:intermembrane space AAA protease IAP-1 [Aspergillus saccharolyticus JOP 1030-1]PYH46034.1 intermembrane space AAA protease IAP-1 [Aspergillus saccharolyticus JOP 1030-1]
MAFQVPIPRPSMAAVAFDAWPSLLNLLSAPWKQIEQSAAAPQPQRTSHELNSIETFQISLPEFLATTPSEALRSAVLYKPAEPQRARSLLATAIFWSSPSITSRRVATPASRFFSTLTANPNRIRHAPQVHGLSPLQQQRYLFGGPSQALLAQREKTANNNPSSANAQNAFYQALLRANHPAIIIERYRSGYFASNAATEAIYHKALQRVSGADGSTAFLGANHQSTPDPLQQLRPEQIQAIGQAVVSKGTHGKFHAAPNQSGTGAKDAPLYVVVEESLGGTIFRWVRFFIVLAFIAYTSWVMIAVLLETSGLLKNVKGAQNNEAQPEHQTVRFSDVHGCDEAKDELQELVEFLVNPDRFNSLGGKLPKGVLLVGPPGTGKTLLARAVAGEAGVPFFYMSGSEFDEVYVGVGAKRVRELFNQARSKSPAIIFIDELDAIGAKRNERDAAYVKQTLNQLLTELDGFSQSSGVIIIAATNYPQLLDKALTRPGRFDRKVTVGLPDVRGRMDILKHHMKNVQISTDVDVAVIARGTPGFSGAELENLVNQAAIYASRNKKAKVGPKDFDYAKDKIMMGAEARSRVIQDKDKLLTAYHEAGHALVAYFSESSMPLYKITIVPRGMALGITHFLPEMDEVSKNYTQYLSDIDVSMGGKAAEELIFGPDKVTSGISADIRAATQTAFTLVTQFGYSKKLGNVDLSSNYDSLSSETKQEIESEVRQIVEEARARATNILTEKRKELELLTQALIEYETLTKEEMEKVLRGEKLDKLESASAAPLKLPDVLRTANITAPKAKEPPSVAANPAEE